MSKGENSFSTQDHLNDLSFWCLCFLVFLLPLLYWKGAFDVYGIIKVTFLRIMSLILLVIAFLKAATEKKITLPRGFFFILVLSFFSWIAIATLFSVHQPTSLLGLRGRYFGLLTYLPILSIFTTGWLITWNRVKLKLLFLAALSSGVIVSLIGIAQFFGSPFPLEVKEFGFKTSFTLGNPNFAGIYLVMVLALGLGLLYELENGVQKSFALAAIAIVFGGIVVTGSAGAIFGSLITLVLFFSFYFQLFHLSRSKPILAFTVMVIVVAVLVISSGYFLKTEKVSLTSRQLTWQAAMNLIRKYPVQGIGPDTMRFKAPEVKGLKKGFHRTVPEDAHNIFLTLGVAAGLPALLLFIALLVVFLSKVKPPSKSIPK